MPMLRALLIGLALLGGAPAGAEVIAGPDGHTFLPGLVGISTIPEEFEAWWDRDAKMLAEVVTSIGRVEGT